MRFLIYAVWDEPPTSAIARQIGLLLNELRAKEFVTNTWIVNGGNADASWANTVVDRFENILGEEPTGVRIFVTVAPHPLATLGLSAATEALLG